MSSWSPLVKNPKYPLLQKCISEMQNKCCFRICISKNAFFPFKICLILEMHFRKQHFGSAFPKYCVFCRLSKTTPSPIYFTLNHLQTSSLQIFCKSKCVVYS